MMSCDVMQYCHVEVVELILEQFPVQINHRDTCGDTALLYAVRYVSRPINLSFSCVCTRPWRPSLIARDVYWW